MMKTRTPLSLLVILGIATILLMPGNYSESLHSNDPTSGNDFIEGHEGADTISGEGGHDQIFGLDGHDILNGDAGDDFIHGGDSSDVMNGGDGDDMMYGGQGGDKMFGDGGDDVMYGGSQGDLLNGGADDDDIWGGFQSDTIFGGPGDDQIFGGPGSDNLFGDGGNDDIYGGPGNDNLFAGASADLTGLDCDPPLWNPLTDYTVDDIVLDDSIHYTALLTHTSSQDDQPPSVLFWEVRIAPNVCKGDELFGGVGNDHLIGSVIGKATLDGGEDDDDGDGDYNEDPLDFDQFGAPINNDASTEEEFGSPTFIQEDGPGNDNDVCFWDGGPTVVVSDPDGIANTGDEVFGDDVLVLDALGNPTCETVHILGIDPIQLTGGKKGGGKNESPELFSAIFVETSPEDPGNPGEKLFLSGFITVTFGKAAFTDLTEMQILEQTSLGPQGAAIFPLNDAPSVTLPNNELTMTYTLAEEHVNFILGLNQDPGLFASIHLGQNIVRDKFDNGNVEAFTILSQTLVDLGPPNIIGASYVTDAGLLTIAFNEEVDPTTFDHMKVSVRLPGGTSPDGVTLGVPTGVTAVGDTLEIIVNGVDQVDIDALVDIPSAIELDVEAAAVADLSGNLNDENNNTVIFVLSDLTLPFILSASYDSTEGFLGERLLTITFNENIDASAILLGLASITETGGGSPISLALATVTPLIDGNPISIRLTPAQDTAVDLLLTPLQLVVVSGAFPDLSGNPSVAQTVPLALNPTDLFPPNVLAAEFDPDFGILRITFDEVVDTTPDSKFDQSLIYLSENCLLCDNEQTLGGATLITSSDSDTIELELLQLHIDLIVDTLVDPQLDFDANAFQDSIGNANTGTDNDNIDVATGGTLGPPTITSVDYNKITGLLTLTFDDIIDVTPATQYDLGKVFVKKISKKTQISLSGLSIIEVIDGSVLTIDTSTGDQQAAINDLINLPGGGAPHDIQLDVGKNAFTDDDGKRSDKQINIPITVT